MGKSVMSGDSVGDLACGYIPLASDPPVIKITVLIESAEYQTHRGKNNYNYAF